MARDAHPATQGRPAAVPRPRAHGPSKQGGWIGLVVLLLALVVVALLGKTVLQQMLGTAGTPPVGRAGQRTPITPGDTPADTAAVPLPQAPVDRARAVEGIVQRQSESLSRDVDAASR